MFRVLNSLRLFDLLRVPNLHDPALTSLVEFQTADGAYFLTADGKYFGTAS